MDSQINSAGAGGLVIAAQHGNIDVHQWEPRYHLEPVEPETVTPVSPLSQPSRLLSASSRTVAFHGRDSELAALRKWRDAGDPAFGVQLWHGRGGQGKTRLAAEFARQSIRDGWRAVQARQYGLTNTSATTAATGPTLLIVDYAERWGAADLWAMLVDGRWHAAPTRVLLLARSAGDWWETLERRLERQLGPVAEAHLLGPLARTGPEHATLFRAARDRFAQLFGLTADGIDPPSSLEGDAQGSVLGVHMAALAAVYARLDGPSGERAAAADPSAVSIDLLRREREHWQLTHAGGGRPTRPETMARAVYIATLTRALPYRSAAEALHAAGVTGTAEAANQVLDDHALAYPPTDPGAVLEPMAPDRLGEDFYALQTPGHPLGRHHPDAWTVDVPAALADHAPRLLLTLIEVARRWPHVAHRQLFPLLRERPDVALRAGGRALSALAELPELDLSVLDAIDGSHPGTHPDLDEALAALGTLLVQRLLKRETDPHAIASLHLRLATRLVAVRRYADALPAARRAVGTLRRTSSPEPAALLAEALGTLGRTLHGLGEDGEALTCVQAALRIWYRLPHRDDRQDTMLAEHNELFGTLLDSMGPDGASARFAAHETWERLGDRNAVFLPRLAASHEALAQWPDAVGVWRQLAVSAPRRYEPRLALALTRLGTDRGLSEAVALYRRLAAADVTYRPHLARALARLARRRQSLSLLDEALDIRLPDRFRLDRARILHMFALVCTELDERLEDGLRHVIEAVGMLREAGSPGEAARAQNTCTTILSRLGRHTDATRIERLLAPPRNRALICPGCEGEGCRACRWTGTRRRPGPFTENSCPSCMGIGYYPASRGATGDDPNLTCTDCGGSGLRRSG